VIPLEDIQSVRRVFVDVPEKNEKYQKLKNFQFEIFLKREGEAEGEGEQKQVSRILVSNTDQSYISPLKEKEIRKSAKKREGLDESKENEPRVEADYKILVKTEMDKSILTKEKQK